LQVLVHASEGLWLQAQVRRLWAAALEVQVPTIDFMMLLRTAAHELAWDALFAGMHSVGV
jgi:hypothetical protein